MRCYSQRGTRCQTSTDSPSDDASSTNRKAILATSRQAEAETATAEGETGAQEGEMAEMEEEEEAEMMEAGPVVSGAA